MATHVLPFHPGESSQHPGQWAVIQPSHTEPVNHQVPITLLVLYNSQLISEL
jgi:hypothetical protein